jgi:hypothetical protein
MTQLSDLDLFGRARALHPSVAPLERHCRVCLGPVTATPREGVLLCEACLSDPMLSARIEMALDANRAERERLQAAWVERVAALPDELGTRWAALVAARDAAERALEKQVRGSRRAGAVVPSTALGDARAALRAVRAKIERTQERDPDIAQLLEEEAAFRKALEGLYLERARWEMARADGEAAE